MASSRGLDSVFNQRAEGHPLPLCCAQAAEGTSLTTELSARQRSTGEPWVSPGIGEPDRDRIDTLRTHRTLSAAMSEVTARSAGLCEGDLVMVAPRHAW